MCVVDGFLALRHLLEARGDFQKLFFRVAVFCARRTRSQGFGLLTKVGNGILSFLAHDVGKVWAAALSVAAKS
jgi:hypothetical protein